MPYKVTGRLPKWRKKRPAGLLGVENSGGAEQRSELLEQGTFPTGKTFRRERCKEWFHFSPATKSTSKPKVFAQGKKATQATGESRGLCGAATPAFFGQNQF